MIPLAIRCWPSAANITQASNRSKTLGKFRRVAQIFAPVIQASGNPFTPIGH